MCSASTAAALQQRGGDIHRVVQRARTRILPGAEVGHHWIAALHVTDIWAHGKFVDNVAQNMSPITVFRQWSGRHGGGPGHDRRRSPQVGRARGARPQLDQTASPELTEAVERSTRSCSRRCRHSPPQTSTIKAPATAKLNSASGSDQASERALANTCDTASI